MTASGLGDGIFFGLVCRSGGGPASVDELFDGVSLVLVGSSSQRRARREEQGGRQQYQRSSTPRRRQHHTTGTSRWVSLLNVLCAMTPPLMFCFTEVRYDTCRSLASLSTNSQTSPNTVPELLLLQVSWNALGCTASGSLLCQSGRPIP